MSEGRPSLIEFLRGFLKVAVVGAGITGAFFLGLASKPHAGHRHAAPIDDWSIYYAAPIKTAWIKGHPCGAERPVGSICYLGVRTSPLYPGKVRLSWATHAEPCAVVFHRKGVVVGVAVRPSSPPMGGPNVAFAPPEGIAYDADTPVDYYCAGWSYHARGTP